MEFDANNVDPGALDSCTENAIMVVENLKKSYGDVKAVNDISFSVQRGSLFAFLGINGAGKSTTINIICSTLNKDGGKVFVDGLDIDKDSKAIKRKIGIVFQNSVLDDKLSVKENLKVRATYYGLRGKEFAKRLVELTEMFELKDILNRQFCKLSGGQKRRVDIARALLHEPEVLMLDEPTTGLDPKTRQIVWDIINHLRIEKGVTVFLTTHYMEEADGADKVVIIDKGQIVADGTPNELKNIFSGDYFKVYTEERAELSDKLMKYGDVSYKNECYVVKLFDKSCGAKTLIKECSDEIDDFEVIKGNMDDVFLNATGRTAEELGDVL